MGSRRWWASTWELLGENGASGGGPSLLWRQPAYQKGVVPTALAMRSGQPGRPVRSAPDVSMDGDEITGFAVGLLSFPKGKPPKYGTLTVGGTSISSPMVAGMVTAAQQGQSRPFGFLNPVLYKLAGQRVRRSAAGDQPQPGGLARRAVLAELLRLRVAVHLR